MDQQKIGEKIKELRKQNNLTQAEFAEQFSVTYQAVSKWENGKNLPNLTLLAKICKDFGLELDELMKDEEKAASIKEPVRKNNYKLIVGFLVVFAMCISLFAFLQKENSFQFKTISTSCEIFTISGSLAYNAKTSYLYISDIEYCGEETDIKFKEVECTLYEKGNTENRILGEYASNEGEGTLKEHLKEIQFKLDNFSQKCKYYGEDSLYLELKAVDSIGKTHSYQIPLSIEENCTNSTKS